MSGVENLIVATDAKLDAGVSSGTRNSYNCWELVNPFVQHGCCVLDSPKIVHGYIYKHCTVDYVD